MNNPFFTRRTFILALLAASGIAACQQHAATAANFFPDSAPGWSRSPEVRTFSPDKLSEYIDGDAEKYLKAGLESASTADYKYQNQMQVTVDVYTMSSADAAKTILDSEPAMDAQTPTLGDAARLYAQSLIFRKGPYLVRMVAYQESPQLASALLDLGHALESKLTR
jgi:Family of unknown function (DUF6599)